MGDLAGSGSQKDLDAVPKDGLAEDNYVVNNDECCVGKRSRDAF